MFEIFRLQFRQILEGKKKWLVVLFLFLPVLFTYVNMHVGGLRNLKEEIEKWEAKKNKTGTEPQKEPREGLPFGGKPRVIWQDKTGTNKFEFDGKRFLFNGKPVSGSLDIIDAGKQITLDSDGNLRIKEGIPGADPTTRISVNFAPYHGAMIRPPDWEPICAIYLYFIYPLAISVLLALLYGATLLVTELDGKTLTYLLTRPVRRWKIVAGKYIAVVSVLIPGLSLSLFCSWLLLERTGGWGMFLAALAGSVSAVAVYNAIFMLLGFLIPRRAMVLALIYAVFFEFFLSFVPALVNMLTVTYYVRSLVLQIHPILFSEDLEIPPRMIGGEAVSTALYALAGVILASIVLSSILASRREYLIAEQV